MFSRKVTLQFPSNLFILVTILRWTCGTITITNSCPTIMDYSLLTFGGRRCFYNPDVEDNVPQMLFCHGYKMEDHTILIHKRYTLKMFRIINEGKQPVFLQHGAYTNSKYWTIGANGSLGFKLANLGYDVWLPNSRGTIYSKNFTCSEKDFWDFSLDDIALTDTPAFLKYIEKITNGRKIIYIGHSMGTTTGLQYMSAKPAEAEKLISLNVALAPIVYLADGKRIKPIVPIVPILMKLVQTLNLKVLFKHIQLIYSFEYYFCRAFGGICRFIVGFFVGYSNQLASENLIEQLSCAPESFSWKVNVHYSQIVVSGRFQMFDNGTSNPPIYDLGKIKIPTYIFSGSLDSLSSVRQARRVYREIGAREKGLHNVKEFSHVDFGYAKDIETLLYPTLLPVLRKYSAS